MKMKITVFLGVFVVMALSNAVVPVLPSFADEMPAIQGAIFSAYFFGAFLTVLPAGMLSDRIGKMPLIRTGLFLTIITGIAMVLLQNPFLIISARLAEGIAAGLFVSCAMSWVNEQYNHKVLSGYFFASLNLGLVLGLLMSGFLNQFLGAGGGLLLFTIISFLPFLFGMRTSAPDFTSGHEKTGDPKAVLIDFKWLFLSIIILTGATGVVTSLYPELTDGEPMLLSIQIGAMNVATIGASLLAPKLNLKSVSAIKTGALLMAFFVFLSYSLILSEEIVKLFIFAVIGAIAGFIMVSQMDFLADSDYRQGTVMGLFNTSGYAGMTFLPFFAGLIVQFSGYMPAFLFVSALCVIITVFIDRCTHCRL